MGVHNVGRRYLARVVRALRPGAVRVSRALLTGAAAVPLVLVPVGAGGPGRATAGDPTPYASSAVTRYQATFVARACPSYDAIMANRLRDDGAESLARPGRDSTYRAGQPVDPAVEAVTDDGCEPLLGWRFTLGSGRDRNGEFSVVAGATVSTPVTTGSVPRLDAAGRPTGGTLGGAVTVPLSDEQLRLAGRRQLWVQGGTPGDPLLSSEPGAGGYGFGVLRCGVDGQAGTNVQWLGFASGTRHAFCYAYYVRGAAQAGTVTVRVRASRALGYPRPFAFPSPLSFAPQGRFTLASTGPAAEASFVRAAGASYPVQLQLPSGWALADLVCAAARPGGAATTSSVTTDRGTARATLTLAAAEAVTCTFVVDPPPVTPGLTLAVYADNGSGAFGLTVDGAGAQRSLSASPAGDGTAAAATVTAPTPTDGGVVVPGTGADLTALPAGAYQVTVRPPAAQPARWALDSVTCNGESRSGNGLSGGVTLVAGVPAECVLHLTHQPGSLQLRVVTAGGVSGVGFALVPGAAGVPGEAAAGWWAAANTTGSGVPVPASGDVPQQLPFGGYLLTTIPPRSTADGVWQLTAFSCDGAAPTSAPTPTSPPAATLGLTIGVAAPDPVCTASYQLVTNVRLQLVVRAEGSADGRSGPVVVEVACADGSAGRVVLGGHGAGQQSLPEALSFAEPTSCTITQQAAGTAGGAAVSTSTTLQPSPVEATYRLPAQVDVAREAPVYTVTVTDRFIAPTAVPRRAGLFPSGPLLPVAYGGVALIILGALILAGFVLRRRAAR